MPAAVSLPLRLRRLFTAGVALALAGVIALLAWARVTAPADPHARVSLDSDDSLLVTRGDWLTLRPRDVEPTTGLIFYPGGKAEPVAYAPVLRRLALDGYLVVLAPMPLNLAILAPEAAQRVMPRYPEVRHWAIAGHSLGGVMAAEFAARHPDEVAALLLWASYPAGFTDLSRAPFPVLSVSGSADDLATPAKIAEARVRLPASTRYVQIPGGDHWGFGNFDTVLSTAKISRDEQQARVIEATEAVLAELDRAHEEP